MGIRCDFTSHTVKSWYESHQILVLCWPKKTSVMHKHGLVLPLGQSGMLYNYEVDTIA